ncbi:MAG TPA: hypothetical protein VM389_03680 [Phycisphaerae bacterium]|nr:hypothetical protein [Phycisphaerae bacterium]HUU21614.1 hypothetical protein [Phycisphaerae bacterium]
MSYAIVQASLEPVSADALRQSFAMVPELTGADAALLARDAFGILVENLSDQAARSIQRGLAAQDVATEIVPTEDLPALPPTKALRRADCLPNSFVVYDALNRPTLLPWNGVALIAAGMVSRIQARRIRTETTIHFHGRMPMVIPEFRDREYEAANMSLEILALDGPTRYHVQPDRFQYGYLGDRLQRTAARNFVLLVRDLMAMAPHASANRGAVLMQRDPPESFAYPSRHAFEEETIWILWKAQRAAG